MTASSVLDIHRIVCKTELNSRIGKASLLKTSQALTVDHSNLAASSNVAVAFSSSLLQDQEILNARRDQRLLIPKVVEVGLTSLFTLLRDSSCDNPTLCLKVLKAIKNLLEGYPFCHLRDEPLHIIVSLYQLLSQIACRSFTAVRRGGAAECHSFHRSSFTYTAPNDSCTSPGTGTSRNPEASSSASLRQLASVATSCLFSLVVSHGQIDLVMTSLYLTLVKSTNPNLLIAIPQNLVHLIRAIFLLVLHGSDGGRGRLHHQHPSHSPLFRPHILHENLIFGGQAISHIYLTPPTYDLCASVAADGYSTNPPATDDEDPPEHHSKEALVDEGAAAAAAAGGTGVIHRQRCSLASDGRFLYFYSPLTGLHRIGSGHLSTLQGVVYLSNPSFSFNRPLRLLFAYGQLFSVVSSSDCRYPYPARPPILSSIDRETLQPAQDIHIDIDIGKN